MPSALFDHPLSSCNGCNRTAAEIPEYGPDAKQESAHGDRRAEAEGERPRPQGVRLDARLHPEPQTDHGNPEKDQGHPDGQVAPGRPGWHATLFALR